MPLSWLPSYLGPMPDLRPPAPRPCESCPYRRDVAAGIWAFEEYQKLRAYDAPTGEQPTAVFQCHQTDRDSATRRMCAGWVGCHGGADLLAPRIAYLDDRIDVDTYSAAVVYVSPVQLFASGSEAADHGQAGIPDPSSRAVQAIQKVCRARTDLIHTPEQR